MQSRARKTGRVVTSRRGADQRRTTLTAHPLQGSASAKWLLLNDLHERPDLPHSHLAVGEEQQ